MNEPTTAEQLTLLPTVPRVSARFQLSRDTRERGLRHVAEIRQMLAAGRAGHPHDNVVAIRPDRHRAA